MDRIDRQLLALLQRNNRRRLRDLAAELAISAPTCLRRMRRLEQIGVIRAHAALLDTTRVGFGVTAFVEVSLVNASGAEQRAFERRMQRCAEVIQCAEIAGEVDYLLTVVARDMPSFGEFTRAHLADDTCSHVSFVARVAAAQARARTAALSRTAGHCGVTNPSAEGSSKLL